MYIVYALIDLRLTIQQTVFDYTFILNTLHVSHIQEYEDKISHYINIFYDVILRSTPWKYY